MQSIASAQEMFQKAQHVDRDKDRIGEYGTLAEMTGLDPPLLGASMYAGADGCTRRSDYYFAIYLPRKGGGYTTTAKDVSTDDAEKRWLALAWPAVEEIKGFRTFLVDERGTILWTTGYWGEQAPDPAIAARPELWKPSR